jgi:Fe-S cluster biosynthesis and repair protein YggX
MARMVQCIKLGTEAEGLDFPTYPGELGKRIYENVSKQAWADWLKHQTMLVNENRPPDGKPFFRQRRRRCGGVCPAHCVSSENGFSAGKTIFSAAAQTRQRATSRPLLKPFGWPI